MRTAVIIFLINPLECLLVRSYYCICTSCVSFVNASDIAELLQCIAYVVMRSAFILSHATRLWLPLAPNPVDGRTTYIRASLCVLSWLGNDKSCSSSYGCCGCIRIQNKWPFCTPRLTNSQWRCQLESHRSPEVNLKVRLQLVNIK